MTTDGEDLVARGLGDHRLVALEWSHTGDDVILTFALPDAHPAIRLRFIWVTCMRIAMDFKDYSGTPLVYESEINAAKDQRSRHVSIRFDGAPAGDIAFVCNRVELDELHE